MIGGIDAITQAAFLGWAVGEDMDSETYDNLPDRLIGLHQSMRLSNVLKTEHSGWLRLIAACRHLFGDGLKRNVREGELRRAEHEAAEEEIGRASCRERV